MLELINVVKSPGWSLPQYVTVDAAELLILMPLPLLFWHDRMIGQHALCTVYCVLRSNLGRH